MPIGTTFASFEAHQRPRRARYIDTMVGKVKQFLVERRLRQAMIALHDQDDFVLFDLGIRRDQIEAVVRHGRLDLDPPGTGFHRH
jgi:uncharacterized protein YjiS (DUF1127 family)